MGVESVHHSSLLLLILLGLILLEVFTFVEFHGYFAVFIQVVEAVSTLLVFHVFIKPHGEIEGTFCQNIWFNRY